ncbi:MAG: glycosyltransferase family 4 protein [Ruthenibacterium sp.]
MRLKIAVINQRYGLEVNGGSELYSRQIAEKLVENYDVDAITTCALDYTTWENYYPPGAENINGVTVRRFLVDAPRENRTFQAIDREMNNNPYVTEAESNYWIDKMGPHSAALLKYVATHAQDYDVFIVVTYLYWPAVRTMPLVKDKAIFIPTAHEEPFIHFKMYEAMFKAPRAYVFLTDEEKNLVQNLFDTQAIPCDVMGVGVEVPEAVHPTAFREKFGISEEYFIYVGRIDAGKDCPRLFQYFLEYKKQHQNSVKLVLMGKEVCEVPQSDDIISLGFVSDADKFDGIAGAKALILPSRFESLSISVLEAMTLHIPVIVNGICSVLKGHCTKSNGGLYYQNYGEFSGCLDYMLTHEAEYAQLCENARAYIDANYQWPVIMQKFDRMIAQVAQK